MKRRDFLKSVAVVPVVYKLAPIEPEMVTDLDLPIRSSVQGDVTVFHDAYIDFLESSFSWNIALINNEVIPKEEDTFPVLRNYVQVRGRGYESQNLNPVLNTQTGRIHTDSIKWGYHRNGPKDIYYALIYVRETEKCLMFVTMARDCEQIPVSLQDGDLTWSCSSNGLVSFS